MTVSLVAAPYRIWSAPPAPKLLHQSVVFKYPRTDPYDRKNFMASITRPAWSSRRMVAIKLPQIKQTRVRVVDLNRDGDEDLFVMSTQGSILVEQSFLKHGYARGQVVKFEKKAE